LGGKHCSIVSGNIVVVNNGCKSFGAATTTAAATTIAY
jgi:hypothetical protein